jgi:hypothetical protein
MWAKSSDRGKDRIRWHCRECASIRRRKRLRIPVSKQRGPYERVAPEPFLRWFESYCRRHHFSRKEGARSLGLDEKSIRRGYKPDPKRHETGELSVAMVDKALLYMDTNIRDLYPHLFEGPDE